MTDYIKEIKSIKEKLPPNEKWIYLGSIAVYGAYALLGYQLGRYFGLGGVAYHIAGGCAFAAGRLEDIISTIKGVKANKEFYSKHGFDRGYESNKVFYPEQPTFKDLIGFSKKGLKVGILQLLFLAATTIYPYIGFGWLVGFSIPYLNNTLQRKKTKLEDKLLEECMPNASAEEKEKFLDEILEEDKK